MFHPDKGHIHHQLLKMGFSSRSTVLIIYGASALLCVSSIMIIHAQNAMTGLFLAILGAGAFIFVRKIGTIEYIAVDKIHGWLRDVSDATGISRERRSFLSLQIEINGSENTDEFWKNTCQALERLRFDRGEIHMLGGKAGVGAGQKAGAGARMDVRLGAEAGAGKKEGLGAGVGVGYEVRIWTREGFREEKETPSEYFFKIEVPLCNGDGIIFGRLFLTKDIHEDPLHPHTLMRVEHLRRTMTATMKKLHGGKRRLKMKVSKKEAIVPKADGVKF